MAVLGPYVSVNMSGHNNIHSQLTKSLERILEDAYLSGELKLSGRKLREFPKPVKFDLSDTVVADLSKNRFSEVPDEVTTYVFLEKLLLSQNVIRSVPDAVGGLQSLTYLDLSSNQLTELPREVCQMPLQVLLVPDNSLTSLPKEIGKMTSLAELDASNNRLTQVPMTLGDCVGMRALDLSNNQLGLLPLQITYLRLEHLDVSCNCISSLPLELRNMNTLVTLNLDNNPLVSPPTTVCMRGRVHIFKYLENMANKDTLPHRRVEDTKRTAKHNSYINSSPNQSNHQITSGNATIDCLRHKPRHVVDSGYSTDGVDKRWSNDAGGEAGGGGGSGRSTPSTPSTLSPGAALSRAQSLSSETPLSAPLTPLLSGQYKEALRQQRTQDIYRPRAEQPSPELDSSPQSHNSPVHSSPVNGHCNVSPSLYRSISSNSTISPNSQAPNSPLLHSTPRRFNGNEKQEENKRPVQKVVPSRINKTYPTVNGNDYARVNGTDTYVKPTSPTKSPTNTLGYNGVKSSIPRMNGDGAKLLTTSVSYVKGAAAKGPKMPWNKDAPLDKLSFTMKREFDKQKEESELLQQLRAIIESRLKMSLPEQLAPVLADGVVLCHLANHVRPRAVASVHVPSPAQPKLTMARCRRNVDNFLEACRKIGVEEEDICAPEHILCASECAPLARTLVALLAHATDIAPSLRTRERSREDQLECLEHGTDDDQMGHHFDKGTIDDQLEHRFDNVTNEDQLEHRYDKTNDDQTGHRFDNMTNDDQLEHRFDSRTSDDQARHLFGNMTNDDRLRHRFDDATNDDRRIYDPETNDYRGYVESDTNRPAYISLGSNEDRRTYERRGCVYRRRHDDRRDDYFDETDEFEAANGAYYQDRVQYVTPFYPRGVLTNEQMEIYDTDEVDFPPQMQTNDGRRYDRTKMNLDLDTNWNRACEVRDDRDRVFYTWLCLGAFMISTLVLFFYPL